jgi:hypothetical protein
MPDVVIIALAVLMTTSLIAGGFLWRRAKYGCLSLDVILTAGGIMYLAVLQGSSDLDTALTLVGPQLALATIHLTLFFALVIAFACGWARQKLARRHTACFDERQWPNLFYP